MQVKFKGVQPQYMTEGAAGADLISIHDYIIQPQQTMLIDSGTAVQIPDHLVGWLCIRSSTAYKRGLRLANSQGVIDSDFRDTMKFAFWNPTNEVIRIGVGERIGQLVLTPVVIADYVEGDLDSDTIRQAGFGDTGV